MRMSNIISKWNLIASKKADMNVSLAGRLMQNMNEDASDSMLNMLRVGCGKKE